MIKRKKTKGTPEINTTALPDIIFMLLFFFMVTTVMQPAKKDAPLVLPNSITDETTDRTQPNELVVFLYNSSLKGDLMSINQQTSEINDAESLLTNAIVSMKEKQHFPQKAILRIDQDTRMSSVNKVKELLQKKEILQIEYVHRKSS